MLSNEPKMKVVTNIIQLNLFKLSFFFNTHRLPKRITPSIIIGLIISHTNAIISLNKNTDTICSIIKKPTTKQIDFKIDFEVILGFKAIKKHPTKAT